MCTEAITTSSGHQWLSAAPGWYVAYARAFAPSDLSKSHARCDTFAVAAWEVRNGPDGRTSGVPVIVVDGELVTLEPPVRGDLTRYVEIARVSGAGPDRDVSDLASRAKHTLENRRAFAYADGLSGGQ